MPPSTSAPKSSGSVKPNAPTPASLRHDPAAETPNPSPVPPVASTDTPTPDAPPPVDNAHVAEGAEKFAPQPGRSEDNLPQPGPAVVTPGESHRNRYGLRPEVDQRVTMDTAKK